MTAIRRTPTLSDSRHAADHVRLIVDPANYQQCTLLVVTADESGRPVHHIEVVDCSPEPSTSECAAVLDNIVAAVATGPGGDTPHGLVLALTRPGGDAVQSGDRLWFRAFHRVCHSRGIRPFGVYIVGGHGARPVQIDDAA